MEKIKIVTYVKKNSLIFFLLCCIILGASCKKEYTKYPYKDIEEYSVNDSSGNEIKGVIHGDSIVVYWPPFQSVPDSITPTIIMVSDRATVSPASGEKVPFNNSTVYTVTAQDGSITKYYLQPLINQPPPSVYLNTGSLAGYLGASGNLFIQGQYLITDTSKTRVYLVDSATQVAFRVNLSNPITFNENSIHVTIPFDSTIPPSIYNVKVISGDYTVYTPTAFQLLPPQPTAPYITKTYTFNQQGAGQQIRQGSAITFTYSLTGPAAQYYLGNFNYAVITLLGVATKDTVNVTSQTSTLLTFQLPNNIPVGKKITNVTIYNSAYLNTSRVLAPIFTDVIPGSQQPVIIAQ